MTKNKPRHDHDCDACKFLASLGHVDLYFCPNDRELVRRHGSEGPEYGSMSLMLLEMLPEVPKGYRTLVELAKAEGLI